MEEEIRRLVSSVAILLLLLLLLVHPCLQAGRLGIGMTGTTATTAGIGTGTFEVIRRQYHRPIPDTATTAIWIEIGTAALTTGTGTVTRAGTMNLLRPAAAGTTTTGTRTIAITKAAGIEIAGVAGENRGHVIETATEIGVEVPVGAIVTVIAIAATAITTTIEGTRRPVVVAAV